MDFTSFRLSASITIAAPPDAVYAFIADIARMGEVSPECTGATWESDDRGPGATFIGTNSSSRRGTWERRLRVVVADPPREFAWENLGEPSARPADEETGAVRWGYTFTPAEDATLVEETWALRPHPRLEELGEERLRQMQSDTEAGMHQTLANLKARLES